MLSRPETASSFMGLLNTLVNIYSAQNGYWSVTAKLAVTINTFLLAVMLVSMLVYNYWLI
jgi:hypothetical protein